MTNEALDKLKKLKAEIPLIKPRPGMKARHYAEAILNLPEDRWLEELRKIPEEYQSLAKEHLESFNVIKHGMVRAYADRIMALKGRQNREARATLLEKAPLSIKTDVEEEVRRRFERK